MATCYKFLDTRRKTVKKFPLKIAIAHRNKTRYISTGYYLSKKEWDIEKNKIQPPFKNSVSANAKVNHRYAIVGEVLESLRPYWKKIDIDQLKRVVEVKIEEDLKKIIENKTSIAISATKNTISSEETCFYKYANDVIKKYYRSDQGGSAKTMENMLKSFGAFTQRDYFVFKQITTDFLKDYETWYLKRFNQKGKKNSVNGLGFHMREIRRIYNLAIKDKNTEITQDTYPFGKNGYSIKKEKTDNKNIDPSEIAKIFSLELTLGTKLWHHLNYFKYYFECWGMNFMDIAHLRVYQVEDGRLRYRRRKTRWSNNAKKFEIEHSPIAQEIIDYYIQGKKANDFVFPILDDIFYLNDDLEDKEEEVRNKKLLEKKLGSRRCNHIRRLKTISRKADLKENISTYVGRHSFFSIALRNGVSKSEISEMAGHSNYRVTENYLAGFNGEQLKTNAGVVRSAVAQYMNKKMNMLDNKLILKDTNEEQTILDFLTIAWKQNDQQNPTNLIISLLQQTNCQDGVKAQKYVDSFMQYHKSIGLIN